MQKKKSGICGNNKAEERRDNTMFEIGHQQSKE
jgi:hypothetical protein